MKSEIVSKGTTLVVFTIFISVVGLLFAAGAKNVAVTANPNSLNFGNVEIGGTAKILSFETRHDADHQLTCKASLLPGSATQFVVAPDRQSIEQFDGGRFDVQLIASGTAGAVQGTVSIACGQAAASVSLSGTLVAAAKPNLFFLGTSPQISVSNGVATVTADIRNSGNVGTNPCKMSVRVDGAAVTSFVAGFDNVDIPALGPFQDAANNSTSKVVKFQTNLTGDHTVQVQLDSDNQNIEINESDNTQSRVVRF
jgi:hypothetical protein